MSKSESRKKKICMFVLNSCANDTRVLKEAETLGRAGYDVNIIAIVSKDVPECEDKREHFAIYRVQPRSIIYYIACIYNGLIKNVYSLVKSVLELVSKLLKKIHLGSLLDWFYSESKQERQKNARNPGKLQSSIPHCLLDILMKFHKMSIYASYWMKAEKLASSFQADVYHAHDLNTLFPAYLAARKTGAKMVYDAHELYTDRNTLLKKTAFYNFAIKRSEAFLIKRADAVITVNESIANELSNLYRVSRPHVVMNCPNYRTIARNNILREHFGINGGQQIILYLGSITFNRGLEESIIAMQTVPGAVLAIMGYGNPDYISSLKEKAVALGIEEKVRFVPPVLPHEVVQYAASADIGLVPIQNACKSYYYCSPNKLFESMVAGLPVAASDFPELRRVIEHTNCGLLFDSSNPDDIANVLNKMISDDNLVEKMRRGAVHNAHHYSWEEESKKLLSIYSTFF